MIKIMKTSEYSDMDVYESVTTINHSLMLRDFLNNCDCIAAAEKLSEKWRLAIYKSDLGNEVKGLYGSLEQSIYQEFLNYMNLENNPYK